MENFPKIFSWRYPKETMMIRLYRLVSSQYKLLKYELVWINYPVLSTSLWR